MNLCVSNIAWDKEENDSALGILKDYGIDAIDVAPPLILDSPGSYSGFKMIAMQSLLYGQPPHSIFDGNEERRQILKHLEKTVHMAVGLGISKLIFGSPRNRWVKNEKDRDDLSAVAVDFFANLCALAKELGIDICLEANPTEYNCNFINDTFEAVDFIKRVASDNFFLNLDTSTVILNGNDLEEVTRYARSGIKHIHISSPHIKEINNIDNENISTVLKSLGYNGYLSLEMRANISDNNLTNLEKNVKVFKKFYF